MAFWHTKSNERFQALLSRDWRFGQVKVKVFDKAIMTPVAVSESGYVAIYQPGGKKEIKTWIFPRYEEVPETLVVLHFSMIIGYELIVDSKSGVGEAVAGAAVGSIYGLGSEGAAMGQAISSGKVKSIDLQIKTTDFNNPQIIVKLLYATYYDPFKSLTDALANKARIRSDEIQELLSQFDNLYNVYGVNSNSNTIVQRQAVRMNWQSIRSYWMMA